MAKLIANKKVWIGFKPATLVEGGQDRVLLSDIAVAVDLTPLIVSLDASTRGNVVATPTLDTTFETSIAGTVTATFTAEFYRDDNIDRAWDTLPRGAAGYFYISRSAGGTPVEGTELEVWPVQIISRSAVALANNDSQRFSIESSVPFEPNESVLVTLAV